MAIMQLQRIALLYIIPEGSINIKDNMLKANSNGSNKVMELLTNISL